MSKKMKKEDLAFRRWPSRWAWGGLFLLTLLAVEATGRFVYKKKYSPEQDLQYRALMGLGSFYDPASTAWFRPHPWLVYVLNPEAKLIQRDLFGERELPHINSLGFRGPETTLEKPKGVYRIICLGGSTTFGMNEIDESKTYPQILQALLNKEVGRSRFEVINAGVQAWSSGENLINLHARLLEMAPDMIVSYEGVNDTFAMRNPNEGNSDYSGFRKILRFEYPSRAWRALLPRSAAARLLYIRLTDMSVDITSRTVLRAPPGFDQLAQLNRATGKYFRKNMRALVDIAQGEGVVPVLVTMAHSARWHPSLRLCAQIIRETAQQKRTVLVDFERQAQESYFAEDGVHLLRPGNEALAQSVFEELRRARPEIFR